MMILNLLIPELCLDVFTDITPELLLSMKARGVICDIDNTLVTYDDPEPTPDVLTWFSALGSAGISVSFVSNNNAERVDSFNRSLGFFSAPESGKPSVKQLFAAMAAMGTDSESTVMIGDQIFTDVFAAKRAGMKAILVKPIKDKQSLLFRFKRALEKPVLRAYRRRHENDQ